MHTHTVFMIPTTNKNDNQINKHTQSSCRIISNTHTPPPPPLSCLLHLFNMCLSAISGKLSVIMTALYGRPCFRPFDMPRTGPSRDGCAINRTLPLKLLPFSRPQTLQVLFFTPKSHPRFLPHLSPWTMHQSCLLSKSFQPFSPDSYFFSRHFSVTRYYRNDTRKCVIAVVSAPWLSTLRFLILVSFKTGMVTI